MSWATLLEFSPELRRAHLKRHAHGKFDVAIAVARSIRFLAAAAATVIETGALTLAFNCCAADPNEAIDRAMASVAKAATKAETDPTRPVYHFRPAANWMNDPNGPIFYHGYYHMFYQHNPYGDDWGNMHWGHARSRDLVYWEHLPIALWPSKEAGEDHCFSGCATLGGSGRPMIFYTSIGRGKSATDYAEQWAAFSDDPDLVHWRKHSANPVLSERLHGDQKIYDWRDPFLFRADGRTFLVLGGNLNRGKGGQALVNLYEAQNKELTEWKYLGVLFTHPDPKVSNIECPNFLKIGDRWVLVISPHRKVEYITGTFDVATHQFTTITNSTLDYGNYYAPNCLEDTNGRQIIWGWVNGFKKGPGWNGCLTVPRILTLAENGELRLKPAPELEKLRGNEAKASNIQLANSGKTLSDVRGDTLELLLEIEPGDAVSFGVRVRRSADGKRAVNISFGGGQVDVAGIKCPFNPRDKTVQVHLFLDKSVLEVFVDNRTCVTRVLSAGPEDLGIEPFASGGTAVVKSLSAWPLKSIW
jgi:beta-fructofuranosidase